MKTLFLTLTFLAVSLLAFAQSNQSPCSARPKPVLNLSECGMNATQRRVCTVASYTDTPNTPGGLCQTRVLLNGFCYPLNGCTITTDIVNYWQNIDCNSPETFTYTIRQIWPDGCETSDTKSITVERPCRN